MELHPYCPQHGLVEYCEQNDITMVAYGPLGNPGRPADLVTETDPHLMSDPIVKSVAEKHSATPAQVLIHSFLAQKRHKFKLKWAKKTKRTEIIWNPES